MHRSRQDCAMAQTRMSRNASKVQRRNISLLAPSRGTSTDLRWPWPRHSSPSEPSRWTQKMVACLRPKYKELPRFARKEIQFKRKDSPSNWRPVKMKNQHIFSCSSLWQRWFLATNLISNFDAWFDKTQYGKVQTVYRLNTLPHFWLIYNFTDYGLWYQIPH